MPKLFKLGNHNIKGLVECKDQSPINESLRNDKFSYSCNKTETPEICNETGRHKQLGFDANSDPLQTGQIYNDPVNPNKNVIYRYAKGIRGTDDGMLDLFKKVVVIDEDGKIFPVPIIWGTQEKAVAYIIQNNVRKDNTLVVDRPTLPLLAIHQTGIVPNRDRYVYHKAINYFRDKTGKPGYTFGEEVPKDTIFGYSKGIPIDINYTLYAWTKYLEDMNQILEQIISKFSLLAYIKVKGIPWEIPVKLDAIGNNIDNEPGDKNIRVIKYQFNMVVETYIPQPITRVKSVLNVKTDFHNSVDEKNISEAYNRIEIEPKETE